MKAAEITDATLSALSEGLFDYARINYANGDMVGHTGDLRSTIISLETLDLSLGRLLKGIERLGGAALITADHGNAEQIFERDKKSGEIKRDSSGQAKALTSHTLNPVPLSLFDPHGKCRSCEAQRGPWLGNEAATTPSHFSALLPQTITKRAYYRELKFDHNLYCYLRPVPAPHWSLGLQEDQQPRRFYRRRAKPWLRLSDLDHFFDLVWGRVDCWLCWRGLRTWTGRFRT